MTFIAAQRRQLVRFGLVGIGSNLALYLTFILLLKVAVPPLWAAAICYILGVCVSYTFNRGWSFESRGTHKRDLPKFVLAYGVGAFSTITLLNALLDWLRPEVAQIINVGLTAAIIYAVLLLLDFGETRAR